MPTDEGALYGQPFDPSATSPDQQPPPPGWEQGTWTHHDVATPAESNGLWLLVGIGALVVVIIAAAVVFVVA